MGDLAAFLAARLDEDEAQAKEASTEPGMSAEWAETTSGCLDVGLPDHGGEDWRDFVWPQGDSRVTRFIADHDPARVLREVEAKRAILAYHRPTQPHPDGGFTYPAAAKFCGWCGPGDDWQAEQEPEWFPDAVWPCAHVRHLAAVYRDHPDYDPAWAAK